MLLFSSLSWLLSFLLLCCFYCCCLCDCLGVFPVIIIGVGVIVAAIDLIFVTFSVLSHYSFVLFNTYYVSSCFQCLSLLLLLHHCHFYCFIVANFSMPLQITLLLHTIFCYYYNYHCIGVVVIILIGVRLVLLLLLFLLYYCSIYCIIA